jgi:hypothetical protein
VRAYTYLDRGGHIILPFHAVSLVRSLDAEVRIFLIGDTEGAYITLRDEHATNFLAAYGQWLNRP